MPLLSNYDERSASATDRLPLGLVVCRRHVFERQLPPSQVRPRRPAPLGPILLSPAVTHAVGGRAVRVLRRHGSHDVRETAGLFVRVEAGHLAARVAAHRHDWRGDGGLEQVAGRVLGSAHQHQRDLSHAQRPRAGRTERHSGAPYQLQGIALRPVVQPQGRYEAGQPSRYPACHISSDFNKGQNTLTAKKKEKNMQKGEYRDVEQMVTWRAGRTLAFYRKPTDEWATEEKLVSESVDEFWTARASGGRTQTQPAINYFS
ncbi:hypothetical protein EYF80_025060 [Liparis tanakae]|uniref:Uncharacterized protein n=1 Tax=Liparis tanakae TaxID=230148 RepID=A0A4Z2HIJ6_9TELE|nr:hypothetical protein EYF80_025060 [Liparis tanakae]